MPVPSKLDSPMPTDGPMDPTTESDPLSTLLAKGRLRPKLTPLFCTLVPMEVTMEVFMEVTVTDTASVMLTVLVTVTVSVTTVTTPEPSKLEPFTLTDGPMDPTTDSDPLSTLLAKGRLRLKLTPLFCMLVPMEVTMEVFMELTVTDGPMDPTTDLDPFTENR